MMTPSQSVGAITISPGLGRGWTRVADAVGERMSVENIEHIWVFPPLKTDGREWGTAVIAQRGPEGRATVHTAKYMILTRGKRRGQGRVEITEVGESPPDVVPEVVAGVQDRAGEADPPVEIDPALWFGSDDDEPTAED